jgi:hypothetical protein
MTEREWLDCSEPQRMMEFLAGKASDRKLRLLGVAFCRRIWRLMPDDRSREAVQLAERYADGLATDGQRREVRHRTADSPWPKRQAAGSAQIAVHYLNEKTAGKYPYFVTGVAAVAHAASEKYKSNRKKSFPVYRAAFVAAQRAEARLVRCVVGNPFRSVSLDPVWLARGDSIRALAEVLYGKRRLPEGTFDVKRVAELADALQDAGCSDETILSHLRGPGPHVRGCWPVDLILGRR